MIRLATTDDFELVLPLLILRHQEARRGRLSLLEVCSRFGDIVRGTGTVGVIEESSVAVASIALVRCRYWWTVDEHLEALWNFVHPDYRRSEHAKELMVFAKETANALRLPLELAQEETPETAPKVRLIERQMQRTGVIFRHEPEYV